MEFLNVSAQSALRITYPLHPHSPCSRPTVPARPTLLVIMIVSFEFGSDKESKLTATLDGKALKKLSIELKFETMPNSMEYFPAPALWSGEGKFKTPQKNLLGKRLELKTGKHSGFVRIESISGSKEFKFIGDGELIENG